MTQIVGKGVGPIGLGMMGLTWRATPPPQDQAFKAMRTALKNGSNLWNGAEFYGAPDYNSLVLLERYLEMYPDDADKIVICVKGGANPETHKIDASPKNIRRTLDDSIAQLKDRKSIDVFQFGRRDPAVPIDEAFGLIDKEYVRTGKVGGIGLSEVRAETIHEAVKYTKIAAVEAELSLFSTDILENGVTAACAQYGIPVIAYSPIGRGMLTGQFKKFDDVPKDSLLLQFDYPRFRLENFDINLQLVDKIEDMARSKGCTSAQLAINWVRTLSKRPEMPTIIPIPGSTTEERVEENSRVVDITDEEMAQIDAILARFPPAGERSPAIFEVNT